MRNEIFSILLRAVIVSGLVVFLFGCAPERIIIDTGRTYSPPPAPKNSPPPWAPAHGKRAQYHYRYYPSVSVYYDAHRSVYFYWDTGSWKLSVELPAHVRINVNDYVTLEMDTAEPYIYHDQVVREYPPGKVKKNKKKK
jgi:hypothetical protein